MWVIVYLEREGDTLHSVILSIIRIKRYPFYSVNSSGSRIYGTHCLSFRNKNRSQKNTITANSVYSHSGTVPKERVQSQITVHFFFFSVKLSISMSMSQVKNSTLFLNIRISSLLLYIRSPCV